MCPTTTRLFKVVQLNVDAFNRHEGGPVDGPDPVRVDKLKEAFHEDAWIIFTDAARTLRKDLISNQFGNWAGPSRDSRRITGRVISVTQAGYVASVLLGFDSSEGKGSSWVDFHALLRIDGVWKITNKTATHSSRAGVRDRRILA